MGRREGRIFGEEEGFEEILSGSSAVLLEENSEFANLFIALFLKKAVAV